MYVGEIDDEVFAKIDSLKNRLMEAINKTVDYYGSNAKFTVRVKSEKVGPYIFEPAMLKFRRISSGTSVTISGDLLHIAVADFPDITEKIKEINQKLIEHGIEPVPIPDPNRPGFYLATILQTYKKMEIAGIKYKLP